MPPRSEMVSAADHGYECHPYAGAMLEHSPVADDKILNMSSQHRPPSNKLRGSPSSPRRTRKRSDKDPSVGFVEDLVIIEVEHMDDLPGDEIWYSRDEYDAIKGRNSTIVKLIKSGEFEENEEYSCRGLEHKLKEVFRQRRANKFNALNAVLEEQDRQINRGVYDPHLIAAAYQTVSVRCQESATTIALRDYRFSLNYNPNKPAGGPKPPKLAPGTGANGVGENGTSAISNSAKGDKKKKKKKEKDKEPKKDKKDKNKEKNAGDNEKEEELEDEEGLSPSGKKKGGVRKMARGARRMMRRMSM